MTACLDSLVVLVQNHEEDASGEHLFIRGKMAYFWNPVDKFQEISCPPDTEEFAFIGGRLAFLTPDAIFCGDKSVEVPSLDFSRKRRVDLGKFVHFVSLAPDYKGRRFVDFQGDVYCLSRRKDVLGLARVAKEGVFGDYGFVRAEFPREPVDMFNNEALYCLLSNGDVGTVSISGNNAVFSPFRGSQYIINRAGWNFHSHKFFSFEGRTYQMLDDKIFNISGSVAYYSGVSLCDAIGLEHMYCLNSAGKVVDATCGGEIGCCKGSAFLAAYDNTLLCVNNSRIVFCNGSGSIDMSSLEGLYLPFIEQVAQVGGCA